MTSMTNARQCAQGQPASLTRRQLDANIAEAARRFYGSPMWFQLYMNHRMPVAEWPEYDDLRDALMERGIRFTLARPMSWRWWLARWKGHGMSMIDPRLTCIIKAHTGHCPKGRKNRTRFLALALAGEAGELANNIKKEWRGDDRTPAAVERRLEKMKGELVDVANYTFMLAAHLGVDLGPAMLQKFADVDMRPEFHNYGSGK